MEEATNAIVLVVDDEEGVRNALRRLLVADDYSVLLAENGEDALKVLQDTPVHIIISDQNMPGLSGIDLLKLVRVRHPRIVRILLTRTTPRGPGPVDHESEVYRFIRKPGTTPTSAPSCRSHSRSRAGAGRSGTW